MTRLQAIYGGAFDPVHEGHLAVARAARAALDADIALVPTGDPRHRAPAHAAAVHRVAMLERAIAGEARFALDLREIRRNGPSYSIDTLAELRAELGPTAPLAMIVGSDAFAGLPTWQRWRELFECAHIVVASRPAAAALPAPLAQIVADRWQADARALHATPAGWVFRLELPLQPQASSAIRQRCAAGLPLAGWVPAAVVEYIRGHGLYGAA